MQTKVLLALLFIAFSLSGFAQTDETQACACSTSESGSSPYVIPNIKTVEYNKFSGEGELGLAVTSGNTNTENLIGILNLDYEEYKWKHSGSYDTQKVTDSEIITVERSTVTLQSDYKYTQKRYAFLAGRYEDDQFSGFNYQRSVSAGHGWYLIKNDLTKFNIELGAGYKESRSDLGEDIDESILRLYSLYSRQLGQNTHIRQKILVESGDENTHFESTTGFKVSINSNLALKITLNIKRNSNPPLDTEPTDRSTAVTLVYGF